VFPIFKLDASSSVIYNLYVCNLVPRVFALVEVTDKEISAIKINSVPKKHKKLV
jgi:hypothetical protein